MSTEAYKGAQGGMFASTSQLSSIQVVNWGLYRGYHMVELPCDFETPSVIGLTGGNGVGKTALVDAYMEVVAGDRVYNRSGGDRGQRREARRTLTSYLRGVTGTVEGEDGFEHQRMLVPLDEPVWGCVAATFSNDAGGCVTAGKTFWLGRALNSASDVATVRFTVDGCFDISRIGEIVRERFTASAFSKAFPEMTVYKSEVEYKAGFCSKVGLGVGVDAAKVFKLLQAVVGNEQVGNITELFTKRVLEEPSAIAVVDRAVNEFDSVRSVYDGVKAVAERRACLERIADAVWAYRAVESDLADARAACTQNAVEAAIDSAKADVAAEIAAVAPSQINRCTSALEDAQAAGNAAEQAMFAAMAAVSGDVESENRRLKGMLAEALRAQSAVLSERSRWLSDSEAVAEFGDVPSCYEAWEKWVASAKVFLDGYDDRFASEEAKLDAAVKRIYELEGERRDKSAEAEYLASNRGMVPLRLRKVRDELAEKLSVESSMLPFAAELMEITDPDSVAAVEGLLHDVARTILLPESLACDLGPLADEFEEGARVRVCLRGGELPSDTSGSLEGLLGCVEVDASSPFAPAVVEMLRELETASFCDADALDASEGIGVTSMGQVRCGSRGVVGFEPAIIGMDNTAALEALVARLADIEAEITRAAGEKNSAVAEQKRLTRLEQKASAIVQVSFADIDFIGAKAAVEAASAALESFRAEKGVAELEQEVNRCRKEYKAATVRVNACTTELEELRSLEQEALSFLESSDSEEEPSKLLIGFIKDLERAAGDRVSLRDKWHDACGRSAAHLLRKASEKVDELSSSSAGLRVAAEAGMREYSQILVKAVFGAFGPGSGKPAIVGTDIDDADYYLDQLELIGNEPSEGLAERWVSCLADYVNGILANIESVLERDKADIEERISGLNEVMRPLPYGRRHGTLSLRLKWVEPKELFDLCNRLREVIQEAMAIDFDAERLMNETTALVESLRPCKADAAERARLRLIDRRCHLKLDALNTCECADGGTEAEVIKGTGGASGGEGQEVMAFLQAAALLYILRCDTSDGTARPSFGTVVLDEAFEKCSYTFAARGIDAWTACGFQLILVAPQDRMHAFTSCCAEVYVVVRKPDDTSEFMRLVPGKEASGGSAEG